MQQIKKVTNLSNFYLIFSISNFFSSLSLVIIYNSFFTTSYFADVVEELPYVIRTILNCKKIVNKFDKEITKILMSKENYAEIIIDDFIMEQYTSKKKRLTFTHPFSYNINKGSARLFN